MALPAAAADAARSGTLKGGAAYVLRPVGGAAVAAIAIWFRAPSAGFADPISGLGRLSASAVADSRPVTGTSLATFVDGVGGRLVITAYPESIAVSVLVPADAAAGAVQALTRAYFAPVLSNAGLTAAKRGVAEEAQIHAFSPAAEIEESLYGALFAAGPAKYPTFGTPASIDGVSVAAVRAFAERAFRPSNAIVVATGDVDEATLASAIPGRAGGPPGAERPSPERIVAAPAPVQRTGIEPGFGMAWVGPPIADEREATALDFVADYLFAPDTGIVQRSAGPSGAELVGTFVTFHNPGVFLVTATGGDPAAARTAVDAALATMRTPLAPAAFAEARRAFTYHILSDGETAGQLADSYGWYSVEGNASYTPGENGARGRYIAAAEALTPAFVAATVTKYLGRAGATVSVTQAKAPG